jgi:hypothetical protein
MKIKTYTALPFEEGKTYKTKFATGDFFILKKIVWVKRHGEMFIDRFEGLYEHKQDLGICPLGPDRLIPDMVETGEQEVCSNCGHPI